MPADSLTTAVPWPILLIIAGIAWGVHGAVRLLLYASATGGMVWSPSRPTVQFLSLVGGVALGTAVFLTAIVLHLSFSAAPLSTNHLIFFGAIGLTLAIWDGMRQVNLFFLRERIARK